MRSKAFIVVIALMWTLASCSSQSATASPTPTPFSTYTPYPTYTPQPTYTPYPAYTSESIQQSETQGTDIAQRLDLVNAINDFRVAQGRPALKVLYPLMQIAASRVYLGLVPVDLSKVQIDPRIMPANYQWEEWASWGDSPQMLSLRTSESILDYWLTWQGMPEDALTTKYTDIGATYLCNGVRCAFVIIYGGPQ